MKIKLQYLLVKAIIKGFFLLLGALILRLSTSAQCNAGSYIVVNNSTINSNCIINGDLTIRNGATLNIDFSNPLADTFIVRGNILLEGNAVLWVHGTAGTNNDQFIVSNDNNGQRSITAGGSSTVRLENIEFRTQEGDLANKDSRYMSYNAADSSILYVNSSILNTQTAWLLGNMKNKSTFIGIESEHVPTEIYIQDTVQVVLHGPKTNLGIWLSLESATGSIDLPLDQTQPYSWKIGRGTGGVNTQWYFEIDTANPGLGVEIFPTSRITVNGTGKPITGELKIAMMYSNNSDTVKGLGAGLQNTTINNGQGGKITLNKVNLGPIAWQLYALANENLIVKNSVVNEIGISGPSQVTIDSSLLQLAVLGAVGSGGSTMTINNSEIWNQSVTAANNGTITLNDCKVYGSVFSTTDPLSHITVNRGCFYQNPSGCTANNMVNLTTGHPNCNPFMTSGFPKNLSPASVRFNNVNYDCIAVVNDSSLKIFPNPSMNLININVPNAGQAYTIEVYSIIGQRVLEIFNQKTIDVSNLLNGIYIIKVMQKGKLWVNKIAKQ